MERGNKMEFTHFDESGNAFMVDISQKDETNREAIACGSIIMSKECFERVKTGSMSKGDVFNVARIAGIMGAKKTSDLIPLCHIILLTKVSIDFEMIDEENKIIATCLVKTTGKTGVEMEALMGVHIALLTIYDMCKAIDKSMEITNIHLMKKSGGKSGTFVHQKEQ